LPADGRGLLIYQAFLNLVPVAFLTLPETVPGNGRTRAAEAQPKEMVE
jgi:hypothetical protein